MGDRGSDVLLYTPVQFKAYLADLSVWPGAPEGEPTGARVYLWSQGRRYGGVGLK